MLIKIVLALFNLLALLGIILYPGLQLTFAMANDSQQLSAALHWFLFMVATTYPIPVFLGNGLFWFKLKSASARQLWLYTAISMSFYICLIAPFLFINIFDFSG